jgi:hypothetical protein
MRRSFLLLGILAVACANESTQSSTIAQLSKEPISVRGWIADVGQSAQGERYRTIETESARRAALFQGTNVWVDGAPYVSGGVAENGAFVLLDVPPGNVTVSFSAPGVDAAHVVMKNVPGNADVLLPAMILQPNGSVTFEDPKAVQVRMSAKPKTPSANVAGLEIPVTVVAINAMTDRHDFPTPPMTAAPIATVK